MATRRSSRGRGVRLARLGLLAVLVFLLAAAGQDSGEQVTLTLLATTDLHGHVWPYDYLRGESAALGLAKVATFANQVRTRQPHTLLVDTGDTFQGSPLAQVYAGRLQDEPNPVVAAMNAMHYDALAVGNHEFDFGLQPLWRFKDQARFPLLGANIVSSYHDRLRDFAPHVIREVGGVRVGLLGLITPRVPTYFPPDRWEGYEFRDPVAAAQRCVPQLRGKADVVVLLAHFGRETVEAVLEQVEGIDVVFFGHSHQEQAGERINGTLVVQPAAWGRSVAEVELQLERRNHNWHIAHRASRLVSMDEAVPADAEILQLTRRAHEHTERELSTVVAVVDRELTGRTARVEDHPLVDLIHRAQLEATGAEVSLVDAPKRGEVHWRAGPVTVRDVRALYPDDATLFSVEITGADLRAALEQAARYYAQYPWGGMAPFAASESHLETAAGVSYKVDVSRPVGQRILELKIGGEPLDPVRKITVVMNSFLWSGDGDFKMLRHAKVVRRTERPVHQLIVDYLKDRRRLEPTVDRNWEIAPPEARQALLEWVTRTPQ